MSKLKLKEWNIDLVKQLGGSVSRGNRLITQFDLKFTTSVVLCPGAYRRRNARWGFNDLGVGKSVKIRRGRAAVMDIRASGQLATVPN